MYKLYYNLIIIVITGFILIIPYQEGVGIMISPSVDNSSSNFNMDAGNVGSGFSTTNFNSGTYEEDKSPYQYENKVLLSADSHSTSATTLKDLIPPIKSYLGIEDVSIKELSKDAQGSYMYNTVYWLTKPVVDEYLDEYGYNKENFERIVNDRIKAWEREGIKVSQGWKDWIKEDVKHYMATQGIIRQIIDKGEPVTINSVIEHLNENYEISSKEIQALAEELKMRSAIKQQYRKVLGEYGLTYQKENLTDKEFLEGIFKEKKNFILSMYHEYDNKYGFILDSSGAVDSNIAAMGMGMAAISLFSQKGLIPKSEAKDMINKCLNSVNFILDHQPKGQDVNKLLSRYPFPIIKGIVQESKQTGKDFSEVNLLNVYDKLAGEEFEDNEKESIKSHLKEVGKLNEDTGAVYLTESDISALQHLVDQNGIEKVQKYGWGGMLYHFINPETRTRSKRGVEMSTMDSQLFRLYGALYPATVFGGEIAQKAYEIFDKFNYFKDSPFYIDVKHGYHHGWRLIPHPKGRQPSRRDTDPVGFINLEQWGAPTEYHADERWILDISRLIGLSREVKEGSNKAKAQYKEALNNLYGTLEEFGKSGTSLTGKFYPSWQGASWTYQYAHNLIDFRNREDINYGENWFDNTIKGLLANRSYALKQGYGPYAAIIGSQEVPIEGYVMSHGSIPCLKFNPNRPEKSTPPADGTFSPSQMGLPYIPFETLESLRMQYMANPKLAKGRYGFRESYNPDKNFWAPGNYVLNDTQLLFQIENAINGTVWNTMEQNKDVAKVINEAFPKKGSTEQVNDLANLANFQGNTFEDAKYLVESVIDEVTQMVHSQNENKLSYFRDYIKYNDMIYKKALNILNNLPKSVESEALKYVIYKNQKQPDELLNAASSLIKKLKGSPEQLSKAVDIISRYDYEATAMWESYSNGFEPVISSSAIKNNLQEAIDTNSPEELLPARLSELVSTRRELYSLFAGDSGVVSALVSGSDLPSGKHVKGFEELVEKHDFFQATKIMEEEFEIQATLRPYVEDLLGRKLDLMNPNGKDAGYLSGLAGMVKGGLKELPWIHLPNPFAGESKFMKGMAKEGFDSWELDEMIRHVDVMAKIRPVLEECLGHTVDPTIKKGIHKKDEYYLNIFSKLVWKDGMSIEEVKELIRKKLG